jgi:hypothetical protein
MCVCVCVFVCVCVYVYKYTPGFPMNRTASTASPRPTALSTYTDKSNRAQEHKSAPEVNTATHPWGEYGRCQPRIKAPPRDLPVGTRHRI